MNLGHTKIDITNCYSNYLQRSYSKGAVLGIIITFLFLLSIFLLSFNPVEISLWVLMIIGGHLFLRNFKFVEHTKSYDLNLLYITTTLCFGFFTIFTHFQLINNPERDTFIAIDSFTFHEIGKEVSENAWRDFIPFILSKFLYADYYLYAYILGSVYKTVSICGGSDPLLLSKLIGATIGSLTISMTYICASFLTTKISLKPFVLFMLFSPVMENSAVQMRDIYVCFFYIWIFYFVINPDCKKRTLKIIIVSTACILIRPANGLFAFSFIFIRILNNFYNYPFNKKIVCIIPFILCLIILLYFSLPKLQHTLSAYQSRDLAAASSGSLGVLLKRLPIPLNIVIPAIFSQIMPFPFWFYITRPYGGGIYYPVYDNAILLDWDLDRNNILYKKEIQLNL